MFYKKKLIGQDEFGNRYYQYGNKRFVRYKSRKDPTAIPTSWHLWLHYSIDRVLKSSNKWEETRKTNPTGTDAAHDPRTTEYLTYKPWNPNGEE